MFGSRTTRTYQYSSSGGSGGTTVTETRTTDGPDGRRTETKTYGGGGGVDNFNTKFGGMNVSGGDAGRRRITTSRSRPVEGGRFMKGWGSRKDRRQTGPPMQLEGKNYAQIKAECKASGRLFEDPDFPAVDSSIFYSRAPPRPFVWKRPHELCDTPKLFVDGASRFDVKQGELGDCWLLAAVSSLCIHKEMLYRVVPRDQTFDDSDYAGIFHFQFWQYGKWTDVIVDDRLPTYYDKLVFMHSAESNEFWTPLLEKAYAKLTGSYEALKGGATSEAMEDFTGGVTETFELSKSMPPALFQIMLKAHHRNSLMGCSIEADPGKIEAELSNGLIMGHAYSVTDVKLVNIQTSRTKGKIPMVRIRNPWGNECEWNGPWSDKSQEWRFIPDDQRKEIGLTFADDGEFWMSFNDFIANFQKLEICNLGPDSIAEGDHNKKHFEATTIDGSWRRRVNAGGCRNFLETFWTNPQYRVHVMDTDEDDDDTGTLIVALMQKNRRKLRVKEGTDLLTCGYVIYKVPDELKDDGNRPLDMRFFKYNASVAKAPAFINLREVCGRHKLAPGTYCVLPSTFEPNQEGDFLLRIFSEQPNKSSEMDEETGMSDVQVVAHKDADSGRWRLRVHSAGDSSNRHGQHSSDPHGHHSSDPHGRHRSDRDRHHKHERHGHHSSDYNTGPHPSAPRHYLRTRGFSAFNNDFSKEISFFSFAQPTCDDEHLVPVVENPIEAVYVPTQELTEEDVAQDKAMRESFKRVSGEDMEVDAYELQDILNAAFLKEFKFDGFSADTCRSMVAMMDIDRSGKLGYEEFKKLWNDLRLWKGVFKQFDKDKSGKFNSHELRQAFHASGFSISNGTFNALVQRYSHRDGCIYFDDYIHCTVRLRTMFDIFKESTDDNTGKANFSLDEFIQTTMYS